jgi:hypothetical protein
MPNRSADLRKLEEGPSSINDDDVYWCELGERQLICRSLIVNITTYLRGVFTDTTLV